MIPFPNKKYNIIYADPPWSYSDSGCAGAAAEQYPTMKIEDLAVELKKNYTIIIVTHNMQQASRISDKTAFFLQGKVVEFGETEQIFNKPREKETENYISGKFG